MKQKQASKSNDFNNNIWDAYKDVGNIDQSNTVPEVLKPQDKYYKQDPTTYVKIWWSPVARENWAKCLGVLNFNHKHIFADNKKFGLFGIKSLTSGYDP